jgi:DnaK suppressor protein
MKSVTPGVITMTRQQIDLAPFEGFEPYQQEPGEPYMNEHQKAHFRGMLEHWRQELMEGVDRTVDSMQEETHHHPDPNDRATQESDIGMELRTRDRERKLLAKIEHTLSMIDEDEYGYCSCCGEEIGIKRLEARPTADLCIECKTQQEQQETHFV